MGGLFGSGGNGRIARLLVAECDGMIRDGAQLRLIGATRTLNDGDMVLFRNGDELSAGLGVEIDGEGLHAMISFSPWETLRIGLEARGDGVYAFRPARHHMEMRTELQAHGGGARIS